METSQDPVEVSPGSGVGHLVDPNSGSKMDCTPSLEPGVENLREACDVRVPDAAVVVGDAAAASQGSLEPTPLASDASNVLAFRPQLVLNIPSHVLGPAVTVGDSQNSLNPSPPPAPDASNIPVSSIPGFVDDLIDTYRNASLGNSDGLILHSHPPTTLMTTASVQGEQPMGSSPDASSANLLFGGYGSALSFPVITWPSGQLITGCPTSVLQENGMSSTNGGFDHRYQSGPYIHVPQNEGLNMLRIPCAPMPPGMAYARFPISDCGGPYDPMRLGVGATPMGARTTSLESSDQAPSTLSSPQSLSEQSATLGALNVMGLNYKRTVFFFFVLALQNGLEPRIEFRNYFDSKWVVRLTLVGEKLEPQQSFDTKFAAKAHVCREGLLALKVRYPNWVLPKVPRVDLVGDTWSWSAILQGMEPQSFVA